MIRAAIFDMDGTMYDTERVSWEGWQAGCRHFGYDLPFSRYLAFRGRSNDKNREDFLDICGRDADFDGVRAIRREYVRNFRKEHGIIEKPGLHEVLEACRKKGLKIGVATTTSRDLAEENWKMTGVSGYFHETVCGDEVRNSKPDPEIFLKAAAKLGVRPEECLVLEDSPNGILAAYLAGCAVMDIPDLDEPDEETRARLTYLCKDLSESAEIIRNLPEPE